MKEFAYSVISIYSHEYKKTLLPMCNDYENNIFCYIEYCLDLICLPNS